MIRFTVFLLLFLQQNVLFAQTPCIPNPFTGGLQCNLVCIDGQTGQTPSGELNGTIYKASDICSGSIGPNCYGTSCSIPYNPSNPFPSEGGGSVVLQPPPLPFVGDAVIAALGLGGAMVAGVGALAAAPFAVAGGLAVALFGAINTAVAFSNYSNATNSIAAVGAPITVNITNAASFNPPPLAGDLSPPSIVADPNGRLVPGGGGMFSGNGATGGWEQTGGATGEWTYSPPVTAENPTRIVTARIDPVHNVAAQQIPSLTGGPASVLTVAKSVDGSVIVTKSGNVAVTDAQGSPTTVDAHVTTVYPNPTSGAFTVLSVAVSPTLGNGSPSAGQTLTVTGSGAGGETGTGMNNGSGIDPGTPGGGCGGGDCATETTQLANKAFLERILNSLVGTATPPADPAAYTSDQIKQAGFNKNSNGVFGNVLGWRLPAHSSACPTSSFQYKDQTFTFDAHCALITDHFGAFRNVMIVIFTLAALFVVLRA